MMQYGSKKLFLGLLMTGGIICAPAAQAALEDLGNGVIKDTDLGIVWLADANYSKTSGYNTNGLMAWNAANTWVDQLNVGGHSDWRLPTTDEFSHLFLNELDGVKDQNIYDTHNNANFALFSNIQAPHYTNAISYWTTTPTGDADIRATFSFNSGRGFTDNMDAGHFAMAVRTVVPEPETYALLLAGLGLVSLVARKRKQGS
jgi:hypothetical protein